MFAVAAAAVVDVAAEGDSAVAFAVGVPVGGTDSADGGGVAVFAVPVVSAARTTKS